MASMWFIEDTQCTVVCEGTALCVAPFTWEAAGLATNQNQSYAQWFTVFPLFWHRFNHIYMFKGFLVLFYYCYTKLFGSCTQNHCFWTMSFQIQSGLTEFYLWWLFTAKHGSFQSEGDPIGYVIKGDTHGRPHRWWKADTIVGIPAGKVPLPELSW